MQRIINRNLISVVYRIRAIGESIYDQKTPNPKQIDTKGFLTDFGRICPESLLDSDIGKGVISKMASNMGVAILD